MTWRVELSSTHRPSVILGGEGSLDLLRGRAATASQQGAKLFVITDQSVQAAWGGHIITLLGRAAAETPPLVIVPGEESKSIETALRCWESLAGIGARREDVLIALGGGVVGDLGGLVAALYLRGIGLWQIPTSLLAQVDASVGGKVAVNLSGGKNLVGTFYQPDLVIADQSTLATLPEHEFVNGLGEVVKYALLDPEGLLDVVEASIEPLLSRDPIVLDRVVRRCVAFKAAVVAEDEMDKGRRAILNLGHTFAHALEVVAGYGAVSHGRAVGLGLLVALAVSEQVAGLSPAVRPRVRTIMEALGLPTRIALPPADDLLEAATRDKKVSSSSRGFVCLADLGRPVWSVDVPAHTVRQALEAVAK